MSQTRLATPARSAPGISALLAMVFGQILIATGSLKADWRSEADARIEKLRKGDFQLRLRDAGGKPVAGVQVALRQIRSAFHFGTCVSEGLLARDSSDGRRYRDFLLQHFNMLTGENAMKWYAIEPKRHVRDFEAADRLAAFAGENGMSLRGHCLFWDRPKFVQPWVQELDRKDLESAVAGHLGIMVRRYAGKVDSWDVNNEMLDGSFYPDRLGDGVRAWMFRAAQADDPKARLFVNEFGILASDDKLERYLKLIRDLQKEGAPVGGIGIQEHASERFVPGTAGTAGESVERARTLELVPEDVWRRLDRLGQLGLPIHLTEVSAKTDDEVRRADGLEMLFRVGFAHPSVEAIVLWGFWEKAHWLGASAALVDKDWKLLPAGERISQLLLREWRTHRNAVSDANGDVGFRGFYGTYQVTVTATDGRSTTRVVDFVANAATHTLELPWP